jgi:hypothetical protein
MTSFSNDPSLGSIVTAAQATLTRTANQLAEVSFFPQRQETYFGDPRFRESALTAPESLIGQLGIIQFALSAPAASLGSCVIDGSALLFEGEEGQLLVCCGASPRHCWRIGSSV